MFIEYQVLLSSTWLFMCQENVYAELTIHRPLQVAKLSTLVRLLDRLYTVTHTRRKRLGRKFCHLQRSGNNGLKSRLVIQNLSLSI